MLWNKFSTSATASRWMDDSESNTCLLCSEPWTLRLRRHHCRVCHRLVCSNCSGHFVELDADGVSHRVCDECYPKLDIHLDLPSHASLKAGTDTHSVLSEGNEALFKVVLHHSQGLFPQYCTSNETSEIPSRHVYCVVSTAEKHAVLKTTKPRLCDPQLEFRATFEETLVVKADLSRTFESYLIFQVHDRNGSVIGKCRASLGDTCSSTVANEKVLLCKDLPLSSGGGKEYVPCLPTFTYSITRMHSHGRQGNDDEAFQMLPDLPMYRTEVPHAAAFSDFPPSVRKLRSLPVVHMFPPESCVHPILFFAISPPTPPVHPSKLYLPSADLFIPSNEYLVEAVGHVLFQSSSGGVIVKGVLLCTSHRLIFIQYPLSEVDDGSPPADIEVANMGIVQCFPIATIASLHVQKRHKGGNYVALQMTCKDTTGHVFICTDVTGNDTQQLKPSKDTSSYSTTGSSPLRKSPSPKPTRALDAFLRIEFEISWRRLEDAFVPAIYSCSSNKMGERFNAAQRRLQRPFSLLNEYVRLGVTMATGMSNSLSMDTPITNTKADNAEINNASASSSDSRFKEDSPLTQGHSFLEQSPYHFQSKWRVSSVNQCYELCPSYPRLLVVPSAISDSHLTLSKKQRSSNRIPALTWIHPVNGAALCRSSQPLVGIVGSLCPEDETLLMSIRGCTFFKSPSNHTSKNDLSGHLRRHGYRVRRNSLSSKRNGHRSGGTKAGLTNQRAEKKDAIRILVEDFFGDQNSKKYIKKKKSKPISVRDKAASVDKSMPSVRRSPLTSRKRLSCKDPEQNGTSRNMKQDTNGGRKLAQNRSPSMDKDSEGWYHAMSTDFAEPSYKTPTEDSTKDHSSVSRRKVKSMREKSSKKVQYYTLSSDRLRQHNAQLHASEAPRLVKTPPTAVHSATTREEKNKTKHVKLRIVDARPYINAKGNALMGKGYEVVDRLGGSRCTTLEFANIANIHAVKESYQALRQACSAGRAASSLYQTGEGAHVTFSAADSTPTGHSNVHISNTNQSSGANQTGEHNKCENWGTMISETKWLQHLSSVLRGGLKCAEYLARGDPVLVHCSDGWDRTFQLTGIAQILLDPEYRTICGFRDLISKDFISFGHMFRTRSGGGGVLSVDASQESPIFVQFLDCVWQVWRQMPWEFEFSQELLQLLVFCYHSRYTTDFRYNSDAERSAAQKSAGLCDEHRSPPHDASDDDRESERCLLTIWTYVSEHVDAFRNPLYKPKGKSLGGVNDMVLNSSESDVNELKTQSVETSISSTLPENMWAYPAVMTAAACSGGIVRSSEVKQEVDELSVQKGLRGSGILADRSRQQNPSDEDFEFRSRTNASVGNLGTLHALEGLTPEALIFEDAKFLNRKKQVVNADYASEKRGQTRMKTSADSTAADSTAVPRHRVVHLLTPNLEVSNLLLWEAVHFASLGLPAGVKVKASKTTPSRSSPSFESEDSPHTPSSGAHTSASTLSSFTFTTALSSSLAYERGLETLCRSQQEQLRAQEQELAHLRLEIEALTRDKMMKSSVSGGNDIGLPSNCKEENDDFVENTTPPPSQTPTCEGRSRAHSDSSLSSTRTTGSQLIVGSCTSACGSSDGGSISSTSMHSNYSNKTLFQRPFRFHHPTTLLFSPPLMAAPFTPPNSASSLPSMPSSVASKVTPPRGNVSTLLSMSRLHNKQRLMDETNSQSSPMTVPSSVTSGASATLSSVNSADSLQSTRVSIISTATLLEDHF